MSNMIPRFLAYSTGRQGGSFAKKATKETEMVLSTDKATPSLYGSKSVSFINSRGTSVLPHPQYQQLLSHVLPNFFPSLEIYTAYLDNASFNIALQQIYGQWLWTGLLHNPRDIQPRDDPYLGCQTDSGMILLSPTLDPPRCKVVPSSASS